MGRGNLYPSLSIYVECEDLKLLNTWRWVHFFSIKNLSKGYIREDDVSHINLQFAIKRNQSFNLAGSWCRALKMLFISCFNK